MRFGTLEHIFGRTKGFGDQVDEWSPAAMPERTRWYGRARAPFCRWHLFAGV